MPAPRLVPPWFVVCLLVGAAGGAAAGAFFTRAWWGEWLTSHSAAPSAETEHHAPTEEPRTLKLTPQARANLGLVSRPVALQPYWRTIQVPGSVVDRPGQSDRGVTAPAGGVVAKIHAFPGDTIKPGDLLFTLRIISEYLQNTQTELFKATREAQMVQAEKDRLKDVVESGAVSKTRLIEVENQLRRQHAAVLAYRQDLLVRGLTPAQLDRVAAGKFVAEIEVVAPRPFHGDEQLITGKSTATTNERGAAPAYEVQDLKTDLGQQVQAGQILCLLANHQTLYIEGRGFRREAAPLERAAQNGWPVRVAFSEDDDATWPPPAQTFAIHHLANAVDPASRTFAFYLPLANQSRAYVKDGKTYLVWRYRPGQRVRLQVPVEEFKDVLVLPAEAVVREGPEAYVFRQNGDLFDRRPVHVLYEDRQNVVLANDGSLAPGLYVAHNAAASLNRVLKAQNTSGGPPPGFHVHPDGTVHGAH